MLDVGIDRLRTVGQDRDGTVVGRVADCRARLLLLFVRSIHHVERGRGCARSDE